MRVYGTQLPSFLRGLALAQLHEGSHLRIRGRKHADVGERQVHVGEEREDQRHNADAGTHDQTADLLHR